MIAGRARRARRRAISSARRRLRGLLRRRLRARLAARRCADRLRRRHRRDRGRGAGTVPAHRAGRRAVRRRARADRRRADRGRELPRRRRVPSTAAVRSSVRPATPEEDAQRRDFTINGMFRDPRPARCSTSSAAGPISPRGVVRAIGDPAARFDEDRLRMLRAVRFAARLDFAIEPATLAAIRAHAPAITSASPGSASATRSCASSPKAPRGAASSCSTRPACSCTSCRRSRRMKGVEQSPDYHPEGDVFTHTLLLLASSNRPSETLALGALLHDVAKRDCADRRRMAASRSTATPRSAPRRRSRSASACAAAARSGSASSTSCAPPAPRPARRRCAAAPCGASSPRRASTSCSSWPASTRSRRTSDLELVRVLPRAQAELRATSRSSRRRCCAAAICSRSATRSGPLFAEILRAVEERQLEGELTTRDDGGRLGAADVPRGQPDAEVHALAAP